MSDKLMQEDALPIIDETHNYSKKKDKKDKKDKKGDSSASPTSGDAMASAKEPEHTLPDWETYLTVFNYANKEIYVLDEDGNKVTREDWDKYYGYIETKYVLDTRIAHFYTDENGNRIEKFAHEGSYESTMGDNGIEELRGLDTQQVIASDEHCHHGHYEAENVTYVTKNPTFYDKRARRIDTENHTLHEESCDEKIEPSTSEKAAYKNKKLTPKAEGFVTTNKEIPAPASVANVGTGTLVKDVVNTRSTPELIPNSLFIDDKASQDDIIQGNIGDCYFLAALLQIMHYDPEYIKKIISISGDGEVRTRLHHLEKNGDKDTWVPTDIVTKFGLTETVFASGKSDIYSAKFRVSLNPKTYQWNANFNANKLKLNRTDYYQAALWVACLEQAFGIFAQKYGKFGEGATDNRSYAINEALQMRHSVIEGGSQVCTLGLFFGNDLVQHKTTNYGKLDGTKTSNEDFDSMLIESRKSLIEGLYNLARSQNGDSDIDYHIGLGTVSCLQFFNVYADGLIAELKKDPSNNADNCISIVESLKGHLNAALDTSDWKTYETERNKTYDCIDELNKQPEVKNYSIYKSVVVAAGSVFEYPEVSRNYYIYSEHAYNVDHVMFRTANGEDIDVMKVDFDTLMQIMDIDKSTMIMQNPHGTSGKHLVGDSTDPKKATGSFETSIREAMSATDSVEVGMVKNLRKNK